MDYEQYNSIIDDNRYIHDNEEDNFRSDNLCENYDEVSSE